MKVEEFMEQARQAAYDQILFQIERLEMMGVDRYFIEQSLSYGSVEVLNRYGIKEMEDKFEDCVRECPSVESNIQPMDDPDDFMDKEIKTINRHPTQGFAIDTEELTKAFVDDGLHQGRTVEDWEYEKSNVGYAMDAVPFTDFVIDELEKVEIKINKALKSAIAFRDGDIEGYRAMHGGV